MTAPRITADLVRRVLDHPDSVIVWLPAVDLCDVAETGLTAAQADSPTVIPVIWHDSAATLFTEAGTHAEAARQATRALAGLL